MTSKLLVFASLVFSFITFSSSTLLNLDSLGGISDDETYEVAYANGQLLNDTINALQPGDTLLIPNKTYTLVGGIIATGGLYNVTFIIDGTLSFTDDRETWPKDSNGDVEECIYMENLENVIFTSTGKGTLNGNGRKWWGAINYLVHQEDRPRLLHIRGSKNILVEHILFKDSPFWTFYAAKSDGLIIRHSEVSARMTDLEKHDALDLTAFNTDGFDVTGRNVYIHDCTIWNQDDCIAVKDDSEHMLFERISCSGLGLVIGSIGASKVNNITFRDSTLPNTLKGIYMKTRWSDEGPDGTYDQSITNILYENITMEAPEQYGIWIGPAQQTGQPCSLLWTITPHAECLMSGYQTWENITLRNIFINNPLRSPGVLLGNETFPMKNVVFDNVVVRNPGEDPWGSDFYYCDGIEGFSIGETSPSPPCFKALTP